MSFTFALLPRSELSVMVKLEVPSPDTFESVYNIISPATALPPPAVRTDKV